MKYKTEREHHKNYLLKDGDYTSTKEIFERIAKYIPEKNILAELDKNKNIVYYNAKQILEDIESIGNGLIEFGVENKHIAIAADNSYNYVITDLAIAGGVGVITPIDKDAPEELFAKLINTCEAEVLIFSANLIKKVEKIKEKCKKTSIFITIDKKIENYPFLGDIKEQGKKVKENVYRNKKLDLNAPAKILLTSGTTGPNKAVVLTQNNLAANVINCLDTVKADSDEKNTSMSILPMHHATEINTHILPRIAAGRLTYINDDMKNMMINIKIFKPYVITIVPMIANVFYRTIWANVKKAGMEAKLKKGIKLCKLLRKIGIDKTHSLFKDVYAPFGGNLTQIVCGGAPLNPEVVKGFNDLGVFILNGYGITECGPLVSMNSNTLKDPYSIGKACPGLEVKLADINEDGVGELCVRGKSVSLGYYKEPEKTKEVFEEDGFFHTGDLVTIDKNGYITIAGRKKNVIILESGKNICPEEIETEVQNTLDYIKEVVVYMADYQTGNQVKNNICAGIYLGDEQVDREKILHDFRELNKVLPNYKRINYVHINKTEYEKTSTKKIIRDKALKSHDPKNGIII